jgi:leader peptidase (prepilin peptidase)/N-methyltransferase
VVLGKRGKGVPMAFGPYLAAAGWIMLMWGPGLVESYLGLYGPR